MGWQGILILAFNKFLSSMVLATVVALIRREGGKEIFHALPEFTHVPLPYFIFSRWAHMLKEPFSATNALCCVGQMKKDPLNCRVKGVE
jgi:hypothetical protein